MQKKGHIHIINQTIAKAESILVKAGFQVASGPEVETEEYNFDKLNIPKDHPARDMWDTFWLKDKGQNGEKRLLRTHTSPVQVRFMEVNEVPIKIVSPGKVFRYEATDATHEAQFYQLEGLYVDKNVSMADLKGTLNFFFKEFLGEETRVRFRPTYFPFVEPGIEVDVSCPTCPDQGYCRVCKSTGWIELLGAGMVHPNVLNSVGIDPNKYSGFAFGFGLDRLIMVKYGIPDVRLLYHGDLRFINQF